MASNRIAMAEGRWVDDEQVLEAKRLRLSAGFGLVRFESSSTAHEAPPFVGSGLSLEEAVGLGMGLEAGVRFGLRFDENGRGLRADEVARGFDTETFGTGLSITANPELRLRWRALKWKNGEAGLENRLVLPSVPAPNVTDVLGAWTSVRIAEFARADIGLHGVLASQSFAEERAFMGGFGMPIDVWANLTRAVFVGLVSTSHFVAATRYSASSARWTLGLGTGARVLGCDVTGAGLLPDALGDFTNRLGLHLGLSCRL